MERGKEKREKTSLLGDERKTVKIVNEKMEKRKYIRMDGREKVKGKGKEENQEVKDGGKGRKGEIEGENEKKREKLEVLDMYGMEAEDKNEGDDGNRRKEGRKSNIAKGRWKGEEIRGMQRVKKGIK